MTWVKHKVAVVENRPEMGGLHVVGWVDKRHCGCEVLLGMRMDRQEVTTGVTPCAEHGAQSHRAIDTMKHMPPQDEPILELYERLFESELVASGLR